MISRSNHHHQAMNATRVAEDLKREVWAFAQAVMDAESENCAENRMNYWKNRLQLSLELAKAKGMDSQEIARQCELSLGTPRGSRYPIAKSIFQIESHLRQHGVPARLNPRAPGLSAFPS